MCEKLQPEINDELNFPSDHMEGLRNIVSFMIKKKNKPLYIYKFKN